MELAMPARLELFGICKAYPAVVANDDISLSIDAGSIHVENKVNDRYGQPTCSQSDAA